MFTAANETTASTLTYALRRLVQNPKIQTKMQEEIDRVVGRNRSVNLEDRIR